MDVLFAMTRSTLAICGLIFNTSVIYITVRANWLHTPCNILLAIYEFCLLSFDLNKLFELKRLLTDWDFSMTECFFISAPFLALFSISFVLMAAIAIDRLISVIWPLSYPHLSRPIYFLLVSLATLGNAAFLLYLAYSEAADAPATQRVNCSITSTLHRNASFFTGMALFCELLSVAIYALLWIVMRCTVNENAATKRIFKSLLCILLVSLFGFTPNSSYYVTAKLLKIPNFWNPNSLVARYTIEATNHLALIACCANTLILFMFSWEYRRAFLRYIPILRRIASSEEYPKKRWGNAGGRDGGGNMQIVGGGTRPPPIIPPRGSPSPALGGATSNSSPWQWRQQQGGRTPIGTTRTTAQPQPQQEQQRGENNGNNNQQNMFNKRNSHPQYGGGNGAGAGGAAMMAYNARRSTVFQI